MCRRPYLPRLTREGFARGASVMETLRGLLPRVVGPLVWALIPVIALGAEAFAHALPRAAPPGARAGGRPRPSMHERAPFLAVVIGTLAIAWWRFGPSRQFLGAAC